MQSSQLTVDGLAKGCHTDVMNVGFDGSEYSHVGTQRPMTLLLVLKSSTSLTKPAQTRLYHSTTLLSTQVEFWWSNADVGEKLVMLVDSPPVISI